jgi:hypothetical protein
MGLRTRAYVEWVAGDGEAAARFLDASLESAAGEVEVALRCHELAARVARAEGREGDAAREQARGLAAARTHGFSRFERRFHGAGG